MVTPETAARTLRFVLRTEPTTLDPAKIPDIPTRELLGNCFEGIVQYNDKNEVVPALAEKWEVSADGKTYTFHLRKGVTFHNGQPFTAADVKYSWERALAPETKSPVADNYLDGILGLQEVKAGTRKDLSGVEALTPHTLKVTIDRPRAYFPGMLTYPSNWIVCKAELDKNGGVADAKTLVGTGPFSVESYQPGQQMSFRANPSYWDGKPLLERLEYPILLNPDTAYNNFETGNVDMSYALASQYVKDREAGRFASEYHLVPLATVDFLSMRPNMQPAFAKKEVRQAFAMAIDRQEIFKVAYKRIGQIAHGMVAPEIPDSGPEPPPIPYDPKKAQALLAKAGYPGGKDFPTISLTIGQNSPTARAIGQIVRANLKDNLGINMEIQEREFGQAISDSIRKRLEFTYSNWIADYPDPQNFLSTLFISTSSQNRIGYNNRQFDRLCAQADAESEGKKRASLYGQANRILMEDVPVIPLTHGPRLLLVQPNVQGWRANLCNYLPHTRTTKSGTK